MLEGALAELLSYRFGGHVSRLRTDHRSGVGAVYDAAVTCTRLPADIRADVIVTLPDAHGSAGLGTVRTVYGSDEVRISGADQVLELLERYLPDHALLANPPEGSYRT